MGEDSSSDEPFMMRSTEGKCIFDLCVCKETIVLLLFSASARRELYSLGLIDILTYYGMKKKSAHVAKTKLSGSDADGISTVRPEIYARRFLEFIDRHFV